MSRRIRTIEPQAAVGGGEVDTYFDKLLKYIPADIVGAWIAVTGLIAGAAGGANSTVLWVVFAVFVVITVVWVWKQTAAPGKPAAVTQIVISTIAFVVWVFALGGPFESLPFYQHLYGSILLIIYTLVVALVTPRE